jgi:hypothetical protein
MNDKIHGINIQELKVFEVEITEFIHVLDFYKKIEVYDHLNVTYRIFLVDYMNELVYEMLVGKII